MGFSKDNTIFLLGGHDLEMMTIKKHLEENGVAYIDKGLVWGAKLSDYKPEIEQAEREGKVVYAIELEKDIESSEEILKIIDHHNESCNKPSSLEQVLDLLSLEPTWEDKLVAANDSNYIPGMEKIGATKDEIERIRRADRKAQGVTEDDERQAKEDIRKNLTVRRKMTIVKTSCNKFSPICDALYPYENLAIYNDSEVTFYGKDAYDIRIRLSILIGKDSIYFGTGFVGVKQGVLNEKDIERMISKLNSRSYHIFYFPFTWNKENENATSPFTERTNLDNIVKTNKDSKWERVTATTSKEDKEDRFNEEQYFFKTVHNVIYDNGSDSRLIHHYEWKNPDNEMKYVITVNDKEEYTLDIEAINLNFYCTGVGVLMFYLRNSIDSQFDERSIRRINQFGRRIMPPNYSEYGERNSLAQKISLTGLGDNERYEENFIESSKLESWKPAAFIKGLITDLNSDINVTPIIDDRMLVNCWYANDAISQSITGNTDFANSETWYKHTFIDEGDDSTCQNDEMRKELLKESTYKRWQKYGSLYGISRYSLVCLTGEGYFSTAILARHMRTLYARLFELAIVQQASILRFSQEVAEVNKMFNATNKEQRYDIRRVESLHYAYINFINSIYFLDVTAQDQGIELYDLLKKQFRLQEREADLENEIGKLYEFVSMKEEKNSAENGERLNLIAAFLVPTTLVLAVFGMNDIGIHLNNEGKFPIFYLGENSTGILLQLIITGIVFALSVMLLIHYIRGQKNRTK